MNTTVSALEHASMSAKKWVGAIVEEFDTEDLEFVYGVLRAWLHTLRDRLPITAAAYFAARLPDLIRAFSSPAGIRMLFR